MKKAVFSIFKSLIIAYIVTGILLLLAALLMQKIGLKDNQVRLFVILIYGVSNIVSGFIFGKMRKNRRLLNGIIIGAVYFALLVLISAIINKGFGNELGKNIISLVICILGGAIGGIMS
ncbi:TIGR04086 family membrane protein [Eshraghiella crossota]|jgi:putative membrane protein (TIGR04086 family)|uniref:TIGR04086 family membrane protein n=1 Tax=Eshraghiella crossota TaxID=45851 RepID=UPI003FEFACFC